MHVQDNVMHELQVQEESDTANRDPSLRAIRASVQEDRRQQAEAEAAERVRKEKLYHAKMSKTKAMQKEVDILFAAARDEEQERRNKALDAERSDRLKLSRPVLSFDRPAAKKARSVIHGLAIMIQTDADVEAKADDLD
jgi:hypothetical protein